MFFLGDYLLGKKMFQLEKHQFSNPIGQFHPSRSEVKLPMANGFHLMEQPTPRVQRLVTASVGDEMQHTNLHG